MVKDPHAQAEKLYHQLLELLEEMNAVYTDVDTSDTEDDEAEPVDIDDVIDGLVEEAAERGLDEEAAERVFKSMAAFAKKAQEA